MITFACRFSTPTDAGFILQSADPSRATLAGMGRGGEGYAVQLTTQPGDINIAGSGQNERCDLLLPASADFGNEGQEEWWAHSVLFPAGYVAPPAGPGNWGCVFDFHNTLPTPPTGGQTNVQIIVRPTGMEFWIAGGPVMVSVPQFTTPLGPVTQDAWYDFVYHVHWSVGAGQFRGWLNGREFCNYYGPNLYANPAGGSQGVGLKLANYHSPIVIPPATVSVPVSVVHSRIIRGTSSVDMP